MNNIIADYYREYIETKNNFDKFHNNVINMPRAKFSEISDFVGVLKSVAGYISIIDKKVLEKEVNYKIIYKEMLNNYRNNIFPENRNQAFELTYFAEPGNIDEIYERLGRRFRHYMEYLLFFGVFVGTKTNKKINFDSLNELVLSSKKNVTDILRNKLLDINVKNNDYIKSLDGINIGANADYRPARSILTYCKKINRPVTSFELSVLLGRVDEVQTEQEILKRAEDIGSILPQDYTEQMKIFFNSMGWINPDNTLFAYTTSQQPYFKFKVFLLFMDTFDLINFNETNNTITLTKYSEDLIDADISLNMLDLNNLLEMIDDDSESSNKLMSIIIRGRTEAINKAIKDDGDLIYKFNKRSIRNPIIKNGKRVRNKLIMELAKIRAGYLDEITGDSSFIGKNGNNYVEAHHIIEFSGENGPDVTENIICLSPNNHSLIHHGSNETVEDFYRTCQSRGVINLERFIRICEKYRCLTNEHVDILVSKKLISTLDADKLKQLISKNGIDSDFLDSLSTPSI